MNFAAIGIPTVVTTEFPINYCEQMNEQDSLAEWIRDHKDVHLNGWAQDQWLTHSNLLPYAISTNTKLSMALQHCKCSFLLLVSHLLDANWIQCDSCAARIV